MVKTLILKDGYQLDKQCNSMVNMYLNLAIIALEDHPKCLPHTTGKEITFTERIGHHSDFKK